MSNAKSVRVLLLLVVLLIVALGAWRDRAQTTSWKHPLNLVVYPINGDGSDASARTIATLTPERFAPIEAFFAAVEGTMAFADRLRTARTATQPDQPVLRAL